MLAIAGQAHGQAYKCTVDGKMVYQQSPCDGGIKLNVPNPLDAGSLQGQLAALKARAIAQRRVFVGMTEVELLRSWGAPDKKNISIRARGTSEQWIYRGGHVGLDQYVYLDDGRVSGIQGAE